MIIRVKDAEDPQYDLFFSAPDLADSLDTFALIRQVDELIAAIKEGEPETYLYETLVSDLAKIGVVPAGMYDAHEEW
jgi:hypothetical protein